MTTIGKRVMDEWKDGEKEITLHFQDEKEKLTGKIIDYDDTEIVLEKRQRGGRPADIIICRDWTRIQLAPPSSCHD